jgi:Cytochrome c
MNRWTRWIALVGIVLCSTVNPTANTLAGGWGVTTLEALPEQIVAGKPFEIRFVIRQHGQTVLTDQKPTFDITNASTGNRLPVVTAVFSRTLQRYTAMIAIPAAGQWKWEMTSFPTQKMPMLTVVGAQEARIALKVNSISRGHDLFIAKGCFMCHRHVDVPGSGQFADAYGANSAPSVTSTSYSAEYLSAWLKNPKAIKPATMMPKLELTSAEIQSLVAFLMAPKPVIRPVAQTTPQPESAVRAPTAQP